MPSRRLANWYMARRHLEYFTVVSVHSVNSQVWVKCGRLGIVVQVLLVKGTRAVMLYFLTADWYSTIGPHDITPRSHPVPIPNHSVSSTRNAFVPAVRNMLLNHFYMTLNPVSQKAQSGETH